MKEVKTQSNNAYVDAVTGASFSLVLGTTAIEALYAVKLKQDGVIPFMPHCRGLPRIRQLGLFDHQTRTLTEEGELVLNLVTRAGLRPAAMREKFAA